MIGRKSKELSPNMKEVIIKLTLKGMRNSDISRMFEVSKSTCRSVIKVFRKWVASKRQKKNLCRPKNCPVAEKQGYFGW